jgi:flotillin
MPEGSEAMATAVIAVGASVGIVIAFSILLAILRRFIYICRPNEILISAGRKHVLPDGSTTGYKVMRRGWVVRLPVLETISTMDMRLFMVEVHVTNAYSKGGIPLAVHAIANVKISSNPGLVRNAVERFLSKTTQEIAVVARQTLEGALREVLAQLTPEEVNEDRLKFAETLRQNAKDDFDKLGLELDVLKIQHVADDQQYLQNLGRARVALMIRDAQNAENEANQKIAEEQAAARQRAESAQKKAEATVLQKKNGLRAELARMEAQARSIENEAAIAAETARATAEQELQRLRAEVEKLRLECDVVLPADAARQSAEARARGEAAPVIEQGRAAADALRAVAAEWRAAGDIGRQVYLLQQLRPLIEAAVQRVSQTEIGEMTIVDGGDGASYSAFVANFPSAVARVMAETGRALGMDLETLLGRKEVVR